MYDLKSGEKHISAQALIAILQELNPAVRITVNQVGNLLVSNPEDTAYVAWIDLNSECLESL